MSQHTPGTWAVGVYEATDNFRSIAQHACICDHDTLALIAVTGPATDKQSQDDARLIAAAPEMLEALQQVRAAYQAMFDIMPVAWQTFDDICAQAIAKATEEPAPATVAAVYACPHCHERRLDWLVWIEGDTVRCQSCKTTYTVPEEE